MRVPSPFGGNDTTFDPYDAFVPAHLPEPGPFLDGHDVLAGDEHTAFHRLTRELFEERGVYDMTFDYNLARLNLDERHENAGYRYAVEREDESGPAYGDGIDRVLRAEFTPTTPFCPQSDTLTVGAFRAWNGLAHRHECDLVRVRVAPMHQSAGEINDRLERMEERYVETGEVGPRGGGDPRERSDEGPATDAPF